MTATARDGAGVARGPDGRVVFVEGALPGELVRAEIVRADRRWSRARVVAVLEASPDRRPLECVARIEGCGGCDLLHVEPSAQLRLKRTMVLDQLRRSGVEAPLPALRTLDDDRGRTTVRAAVSEGRAGFRRTRSHEVVVPDECGAVDPLVAELLIEGRYPGAREVTIRVGSRTGERLVVVDGDPGRVGVPDDV
ncbi:MAG: TRAM domain-containing protein, partial [Actinomyces sp.]